MGFRFLIAIGMILGTPRAAPGAPAPTEPAHVRVVSVEPSNATGVPAMRITLTADPMQRTASGYESSYSIKIFPFFFFNETGSIRIDLEPDALESLEAGEVIAFTGEAINQRNDRRLIEGRAIPTDSRSGRVRIVVKVGGIELIFKTTYRFTG